MFEDSNKRHDSGGGLESDRGPPINSSAIARGLQLSTHFVAVVLVGAAIGWLVDRWLGISPWAMIAFLLLGFAAGVFDRNPIGRRGLAQSCERPRQKNSEMRERTRIRGQRALEAAACRLS